MRAPGWVLAAALVCPPAHAQLTDLLNQMKRAVPALPGASAAPEHERREAPPAQLPGAARSDSSAIATGTDASGRTRKVAAELAPDSNCSRPVERFNVGEKVLEYGGAEAAARLDRLVKSDYKFSDLAPEDREMLQYLARTTIWVPPELEGRLGDIYDFGSGRGESELAPTTQAALQGIRDQFGKLRTTVKDFPADIRVAYKRNLKGGVVARFGGVIQISDPFTQLMIEDEDAANLILSHELSHIYKRHSIKQMQYQMISTSEGWELAKKLLGRAKGGMDTNPISSGLFVMTTINDLLAFVRGIQARFTREQELEADACAVNWLKRASLDPIRSWKAFEQSAAAGEKGGMSEYYGSHPPFAERSERYIAKAQGKPASNRAAARVKGQGAAK